MSFLIALILTCLLTLPGIFLVARSRLSSCLVELISCGICFGFGLVVLIYLTLSAVAPVWLIDILLLAAAAWSAVPVAIEIKRQRLPLWFKGARRGQLLLAGVALCLMLIAAFGDLSHMVDDDSFIHFPNIKRVAMGDIPIHMPYFPEASVRGHVGRDLFIGTVGRLIDLRVELAIIYVTLILCPAYIGMFYALAWRLARNNATTAGFCFLGLLFLVSCQFGASEIRAGCITYIWNNNVFAYSFAAFFAWLLVRLTDLLERRAGERWFQALWRERAALGLTAVSFGGQYFIYLSNFLMFALFLSILPLWAAVCAPGERLKRLGIALAAVAAVALAGTAVCVMAAPFFLERVLISLHILSPNEPMGWLQQARFSFPKAAPFTLTDWTGADIPCLRRSVLLAQGVSFYTGLSGLVIGLVWRRPSLVATSLFGWLTILWLLLVDMGEYRAETLRLLLLAHIALGAATGLILGLAVRWAQAKLYLGRAAFAAAYQYRLGRLAVMALAVSLMLFMARGNLDKYWQRGHFDLVANAEKMGKIYARNPEDWHPRLNVRRIDYETFCLLQNHIRKPSARIMLKLKQDGSLPNDGDLWNRMSQTVNAAYLTGAGIVGVCQEHAPRGMGARLFPYGYRASLFWLKPSQELLSQLSPDWIVVDPDIVSREVLETILSLPAVSKFRSLEDSDGRKRLLLKCHIPKGYEAPAGNPVVINLHTREVNANRFELASAVATITRCPSSNNDNDNSTLSADSIQVAMQVFDESGRPANVMDMPVVAATALSQDKYRLQFSMVQLGRWHVYFIDPATGKRLHEEPLSVSVQETRLADALSVSM